MKTSTSLKERKWRKRAKTDFWTNGSPNLTRKIGSFYHKQYYFSFQVCYSDKKDPIFWWGCVICLFETLLRHFYVIFFLNLQLLRLKMDVTYVYHRMPLPSTLHSCRWRARIYWSGGQNRCHEHTLEAWCKSRSQRPPCKVQLVNSFKKKNIFNDFHLSFSISLCQWSIMNVKLSQQSFWHCGHKWGLSSQYQ